MESVVNEPKIREILAIVHKTSILLHGIGGAEEIGRRRGLSKANNQIKEKVQLQRHLDIILTRKAE